ncbi:MAG: hypothetical protein OXU86_01320 [Thaumarchaeota archaeon]|nr:hypothetical protein [Nitrososphaerota archaeon]RNJ71678.1 MAG: hypothetical protein EB832_05410 [Thaumarchaeota archaeon S14]RNJ72352.1 MAG: hypothetical protein EB824_06050 [Thaumarchaeota archaeon S15]RNJ74722.1 MAG: hypothetical protein EB833_00170 [Thaumarchaeota archaeon S13]MDD9810065.1 hypothetical protein [Nitrososphaerota archaeon]
MPGWKSRAIRAIRRIALWPSREELDRLHREDREATKVHIPGMEGGPDVWYGITAYGQRVDPSEYGSLASGNLECDEGKKSGSPARRGGEE